MDNCICGYEFDKVGLYVNFFDRWWHDTKHLMDGWCRDRNIDLRKVELFYTYPDKVWMSKNGTFDLVEHIEYLESLSPRRHNLFNELRSSQDILDELFDHISTTRSMALFVGNMTEDMEKEWLRYIDDGRSMCVHLTPDVYEKEIWVGNPPDKGIEIPRKD